MKIPAFYINLLYIFTPLLSGYIALGWLLRRNASRWMPSDTIWKNSLQCWLYLIALWIISQSSVSFFFFIGFVASLLACVIGYKSKTPNHAKIYYKLGKENLGFFSLTLFASTFLSAYIEYKGTVVIDASTELTIILVLYSIIVALVCTKTLNILDSNPSWKDSLYRGWYYTFFGWILACYGVESVLLVASALSWTGVLLAWRYTKYSQSVGCTLARENIIFISFFWTVRSFIYQPFIVPTGSLEPTIYPGDFVLVNQYTYGLRFPIWGWKLYPVASPERGDLVVFRYPPQPNILYVKRVVGLPGDHVQYHQDTLTINGQTVPKTYLQPDTTAEAQQPVARYREELPNRTHDIYTSEDDAHRHRNWEWSIPADHYLMLGDNRQASNDSRFWGLVPDHLLVGKVDYVILSVDKSDLKNIHIRNNRFIKNVYAPD